MLSLSAGGPLCVSSCATFQAISSDSQVAAPGNRRPRKKSWGRWMAALAVLCLGAQSGFAPSAEAQTAHFSGAVATLQSSSLSFPTGVAVDSSGNVFVADTSNSAVKEILAAGG